MLEKNNKAPAFSLLDENSKKRSLSEYLGQWVVLYFYPKDDTPGCTKEACGIAEVYDEFAALGVSVLGVSKDSPSSHAKFKEKYHLPFTLLSDESTIMIQAYGAWSKKSMFGKKYMGTERITYIIDPRGNIAEVYPKVSPADHALQLFNDLKVLINK
ncbi:thioredoxin-dependent thiol peroxidase [Candidatus Kaiserbacteria bacterium]|nr:thioredoxin-dependent thiol peroxidase [Candidatus Kaiserbacteria bacterium]